jgi:hypothetical protein
LDASRRRRLPLALAVLALALAGAGPCIAVRPTVARIRAAGGDLRFSGDGASEILGRRGACGVEFRGVEVGDDDLFRLKGDLESLSGLTYMSFFDTDVTDAGLAALKGIKSLRTVYFQGKTAKVTEDGAFELERSLPFAHVAITAESAAARPDPAGRE